MSISSSPRDDSIEMYGIPKTLIIDGNEEVPLTSDRLPSDYSILHDSIQNSKIVYEGMIEHPAMAMSCDVNRSCRQTQEERP